VYALAQKRTGFCALLCQGIFSCTPILIDGLTRRVQQKFTCTLSVFKPHHQMLVCITRQIIRGSGPPYESVRKRGSSDCDVTVYKSFKHADHKHLLRFFCRFMHAQDMHVQAHTYTRQFSTGGTQAHTHTLISLNTYIYARECLECNMHTHSHTHTHTHTGRVLTGEICALFFINTHKRSASID
jgi:hypothetical protein